MSRIIISNDPAVIEKEEQTKIVFRTGELARLYNTKPKSKTPSYILSGSSEFCRQYLHLSFANYGMSCTDVSGVVRGRRYFYVMLQSKLGTHHREYTLYKTQTKVKNIIDYNPLIAEVVGKKALLRSEEFLPFLPPSEIHSEFKFRPGIWIAKTQGHEAYQGAGNFIYTTEEEWKAVQEKIALTKGIEPAVVSQYIDNPLLDERGHKCHFRCYVMITSWGTCSYADFFCRFTASEPYVHRNYDNSAIHDTHMRKTPTIDVYTPFRDRRISEPIYALLQIIVERLRKVNVNIFPDTKKGYQILAPDILLDEDYRAYLLEINTTPSYGDLRKEGNETLERLLSAWEFAQGIEPNLISDPLAVTLRTIAFDTILEEYTYERVEHLESGLYTLEYKMPEPSALVRELQNALKEEFTYHQVIRLVDGMDARPRFFYKSYALLWLGSPTLQVLVHQGKKTHRLLLPTNSYVSLRSSSFSLPKGCRTDGVLYCLHH